MRLEFTIPGKPQPKQRARQGRTRHGSGVWYTPEPTRRFEKAVAAAARAAMWQFRMATGELWPMDATYRLEVEAHFPDRRSFDVDNVIKSASDSGNGVMYLDDAQIQQVEGRKFVDRESPRTVVRLEVLSE